MIVWLNGTFGAGKTTAGRLLVERDQRLRLFDPEWVGYLLRQHLHDDFPVADFQEWPSWRRLVPVVADELAGFTGQSLVAVQTVLDEDCWVEIESGLTRLGHEVVHVVLEADETVLRERIEADQVEAGARSWRLDHLPAYAAARAWLTARADLVVDTTELTPEETVDRIWSSVRSRP